MFYLFNMNTNDLRLVVYNTKRLVMENNLCIKQKQIHLLFQESRLIIFHFAILYIFYNQKKIVIKPRKEYRKWKKMFVALRN